MAGTSLGFRDYITIFRRRKLTIVALTVLAVVAGVALALTRHTAYTADAKVLVIPFRTLPSGSEITPNLQTEAGLVSSGEVTNLVRSQLGLSQSAQLTGGLSVTAQGSSELLEIRYTSSSPTRATQFANAFANSYVTFRSHEASLNGAHAGQGAQVVQRARGASPSSKRVLQYAIVALFIGLGLGVIAALVVDRLDDRLRDEHDLRESAATDVLGVIPRIREWEVDEERKPIAIERPRSAAAEAYRMVALPLMLKDGSAGSSSILVTSPDVGVGKTTTAANLGVVAAKSGKRVAVVSADVHRPRLHQLFGVSDEPGWLGVLADELKLEEVIANTAVENLAVVPSGAATQPERVPAFDSERTAAFVEQLTSRFDLAIFDGAPTVVADALGLASVVDGVLVVGRAGKTHAASIRHARDLLDQAGGKIVGAVLNAFDRAKAPWQPYYSDTSEYYRDRPSTASSQNGEAPSPKSPAGMDPNLLKD